MRNISLIGLGLAVRLGFLLSQVMHQRSATAQITTPTGRVIKPSPYRVEETENRFIQALESNGLNVLTTVDHAQNAADTGLVLEG